MQDRKGGNTTRLTPLAATLFGVGCGAFALGLPTAEAQQTDGVRGDADSRMETLYVIDRARDMGASPKRTAPLLDTPQTISVIPSEIFKAQGAQNLTDV